LNYEFFRRNIEYLYIKDDYILIDREGSSNIADENEIMLIQELLD